jgi:hypothetical protein
VLVKKKKGVTAIYAEEAGGDEKSATYFDGKRISTGPWAPASTDRRTPKAEPCADT